MKRDATVRCTGASLWEERLYDYADGLLDGKERSALEAHLAVCPSCRAELAKIRTMLDAVRADGTDAVSVCGPVMEKIFAEASEKEQNASEQDDAPRVLVPTDAKKPVSRQRVLRITGIAAAAVCAVGLWIVMPFFRDPGGNTAGQAPSGLEDAQMNPYFTETDALFDEESDTCETEETEETDDSLFSASPEV